MLLIVKARTADEAKHFTHMRGLSTYKCEKLKDNSACEWKVYSVDYSLSEKLIANWYAETPQLEPTGFPYGTLLFYTAE